MRADLLAGVLARARHGIRDGGARRPDPRARPPRAHALTYRAGVSHPPRDQPDDVQDVVPGVPMPAYDRGDGGVGAATAATAGTGATVAFVLGILSVVGMPFFGPVAWILGRRAGQAADATDEFSFHLFTRSYEHIASRGTHHFAEMVWFNLSANSSHMGIKGAYTDQDVSAET